MPGDFDGTTSASTSNAITHAIAHAHRADVVADAELLAGNGPS